MRRRLALDCFASYPRETAMSAPVHSLHAVLAGRCDDGGFNESGFVGAREASRRHGIAFAHIENVGTETADLLRGIDAAVPNSPDLVVVHGGRSDEAVAQAAPAHPAIRFLSTHGSAAGANFSCVTIAQPQSAYLAGVLAARMTRSGIVGHLSGIRIAPGLRSRAAYAQGVRETDPAVRLLTCFCGTQEDNTITHRHALAEIDAGADILYTMLNGGRIGAIDACRERGARQIGNVRDWTAVDPDVFVGSAIADTGRLVERWIDDIVAGRLVRGETRTLGMEDPAAVRLAMSAVVPESVRAEIAARGRALAAGEIALETEYRGPEFTPD
jgi:basic membrane protein A